jgi:hypothetical protein
MRIDCKAVDQALDRQAGERGVSLPANVLQHLAECPDCRSLHALLDSGSTVPEVPADLRAAIGRSVGERLKPVNPLPGRWTSTLQLMVLFVVFAAVLIANMGTAGLERMSRFQWLAMSALLATGVCLFSASLASQIRPGSYQRLSGGRLAAAFGVGLLTGMALLFPWRAAQSFVAQGWPCLLGGLGVATPGAVLLWLIVRRGAPLSMGTLGATIGATAGLLGVTVLQFRCPLQNAPHLLVWHGGVLVVATVAGSAVALLAHRIFTMNKNSWR